MFISHFKEKDFKNNPKLTTERNAANPKKTPTEPEPEPKSEPSNCFNKKWKIAIALIVSIIVVTIIVVVVVILKNKNKNPSSNDPDRDPTTETFPPEIDIEKVKEVFSPSFKISSKEKTLTKLSEKSIKSYESTEDGKESSHKILTKAIFDIYTINSTSPSEIEKNIFSNKYMTVITVNSICSKISTDPENDDCEYEKNLDLNTRDESNLRRNEDENENEEDIIRQAILPICLVEHTDTNIVISMTCPETLSESYKKDILRAFENIKPNSMKGFDSDNSEDTRIEEKDDKIYITSTDNVCTDQEYDPKKTIICNSSKNIITDKEGIIISSKVTDSIKTIIDENNSFTNTFKIEFNNIPKEKSDNFNEDNYKKNLDTILSLTKSLMKKELLVTNLTAQVIEIMTEDDSVNENVNIRRNLKEEISTENRGIYEENIFNKTICNISMDLNLKNDIGLSEGQTAKAISIHDVNKENFTEISSSKYQTNLNDTLNELSLITKGGNKLANKLKEDINEPLLNFMNLITENIEKINKQLAYKDLSQIFDSTLAIKELSTLPYEFIAATDNLYITFNNFKENILYTIDNMKKKFKNDITAFLTQSHNLIYKLFDNLNELSNALSSEKTKIVGISTYYLNNTEVSFYKIVKDAKYILDNYYKNESKLIHDLIDPIIENYEKNSIKSFEKYQTQLDEISDKLNDEKLNISRAEQNDYKKVITNIYNTKIKINEIIETVKNVFEEIINPYSNGYFESQKEIEDNNKSYGAIGNKANETSYALDNNEFVDKTFDTIMTSFRDKFLELSKNMEKSIKDKFPLEENVLSTTLFGSSYLDDLDSYLTEQKKEILKLIKNENDNYLESVNNILISFKSDSGKSLEQIMSDLINAMDDLYLDNLNTSYYESLQLTFNTINEIIKNNYNLGNQYMTDDKVKNSYHITAGFKNKYKLYTSSIQTIKDFINKNLKINLVNRYKNVMTQIRTVLQSIKSNTILEKYYKQLPSAENHLNSINDLFTIFNRHVSDNVFNTRFLPLIDNFIASTNNDLTTKKNNFESIYKVMSKKESDNKLNDYDNKRVESYRECKRRWYGRKKCWTVTNTYYDGYNSQSTNNHLSLKSINFEEYMKKFDDKYNELYPNFSNNILLYNNLLSQLDIEIENEAKNTTFQEKIIYLDNIKQKFESIINDKLGNNLLSESYNYYKNKITNNLPVELNNAIENWKNVYDEIYNNINSNVDKFKSSFFEFYVLGSFYIQTYCQNISYDYGESVVEKLKNDFNYTNKYYYNIIISKLNKTYTYILNNLPVNEKPFDVIINKRIAEIKESHNNILNELQNSKKEILDKSYQEVTLQVNSKNFFKNNEMIQEHIKLFNETLTEKDNDFQTIAINNYKENPKELIAAKFYLENSINGKQINDIYNIINDNNFIDLQTKVYEKLINDIWNIDKDELTNNIIDTITKLNERINDSFKDEKNKYIEILKNKLYEEFYPKEELISKINSFFSNGINNCDQNSKAQINNILNLVLNKIVTHISNEASRINNELTSYSTSRDEINNRLNNYKNEIYNQFYSTITYVVNNYHERILEKFYNNFIESGLNEFETNIDNQDFGTAKFLNISINLNQIIDKEAKLIITDYKNLTYNQIQFLYKKNIQLLDELFDFSKIKLTINNQIDNAFNSKLSPILYTKAIYNPGDEGVSNYDFSESILNDINQFIEEQISKTKNLIKQMEGIEFNISDFIPSDFSAGKDNIYAKISKSFGEFTISYTAIENNEFNKTVGESAIKNFNSLMDNFIPSFGVDFFNRILKFNEIQKIQILYYNLQYSLAETLLYYIGLVAINEGINLPIDIKLSLFNLNNLDKIVKDNNDLIISNINSKLDSYFEETKNYIVYKYINDTNIKEALDSKFNGDLKDKIRGIINGNIHNYEKEYINMMKNYIKKPFVSDYTKVLNEATKGIKYFVEEMKVEMKVNLDSIFSTDSDSILADLKLKLNNTKNAVEEYNEHFRSSNTSIINNEVIDYLEHFGVNNIVPKYNEINDLLNKKTVELVINNLEKLSQEFRKEYSIDNFQEEINEINKNLSTYFKQFKSILINYGDTKNNYKKNLEQEIAKSRRIRLLEESGDDENNNNDVKYDESFNEIKSSTLLVKNFIQSLHLFNEFEDTVNKYITEKNNEYSLTEIILEKNKNSNENYELMVERLKELKELSLDYYSKIQNNYNIAKEQIINNIIQINEMVNNCEQSTYDIIYDKYFEIKDHFTKIEELKNSEIVEKVITPYKSNITNNYFVVETTVQNYLFNNKITLDIIYENDSKIPKVIGTLENNINPKVFDINFYSQAGQNLKMGRKINVAFKKILSQTNITFDTSLSQANIITNFNFDEYTVSTQYYEEKCQNTVKKVLGMTIVVQGTPIYNEIDTPDEEKVKTIPSKNIILTDNYIY